MTKKILVVGAGAVGGISAGLLKQAKHDITLITKYKDLATSISNEGVHIVGNNHNLKIRIPSFAEISELKDVYDIVLIATKALDMPQVAKDILPFIHKNSMIVSLQNGYCEEKLAEIVGNERTIGCVVGFGATMIEPGFLDMTSDGEFIIGTLDNARKEDLEVLQEILSAVVPTRISKNIVGELYSKLIINSCITSLGAICGLRLGEMLKSKKSRRLFISIIEESIQVANAMNINVEPYANKLNYYSFLEGRDIFSSLKRHLTIYIIGLKYKRLKSSSLQSLERGKKTEIDYFNGYIVQKGKELYLTCPINDQVVIMINKIESGDLTIKKENLYQIN